MSYHAKDGWYFLREKDGSVSVVKRNNASPGSYVVAECTFDPDTWASIIASVSRQGETSTRVAEAITFHMERAEAPTKI